MKPRILKIEGLNSFQKQQIIDFSKLMSKGLFGIFGATGSGKSTILDAIILSLYGHIARNTDNFINSDMDTASVSFEFELNNNSKNEIYEIQRTYKKNKTGGYSCKFARIIQKKDTEIKIIEEGAKAVNKKIEEIIGLNKDDFTRTVVLPQGKFSEFLTLTSKDRNEMLERILHLEEYGKILEEKIKSEKSKVKLEVERLKSKMSVYNTLSSEDLINLNDKQNFLNKQILYLKQAKSELDKEVELKKEILKLQEEKNTYEKKYNQMIINKEDIENERIRLVLSQKVDIVLPSINSLEENEKKLNSIDKLLYIKTKELSIINKQLEEAKSLYNEAKLTKDKEYETLLKQQADLKQALEIINKVSLIESDKTKLEIDYKKLEEKYNSIKQKENDINKRLNEANSNLENIYKQKQTLYVSPDYRQKIEEGYQHQLKFNDLSSSIDEIESKLIKYDKIIESSQEQLCDFQKQLNNIDSNILKYEKDLNELNSNRFLNSDILLELQNNVNKTEIEYKEVKNNEQKKQLLEENILNIERCITDNKSEFQIQSNELEKYNIELEDLNKQLEAFKIINQSSILARILKENTPCPVCGSLHHPNPAKEIDNKLLTILNKNIKELKNKIFEKEKLIANINSNIETNQKEFIKLKIELSEINKNPDFTTSQTLNKTLVQLKQQFEDTKSTVKMLEKQKENLQKQIQITKDERNKLNLKNTRIMERQIKDKQIKSELDSQKQNLKQQFETLSETINKLKLNLNVDNFEIERKIVLDKEKIYSNIAKDEDNIRTEIDLYIQQKNKILESIKEIEKKITQKAEIIKEKQNIINNYNIDIKNLAKNHNPKEHIVIIEKRIKQICDDVENLSIKVENIHLQYKQISDMCIDYSASKNTLNQLLIEQNKILKIKLEENDFKNVEEVKALFIDKQKQSQMKKIINDYDNEYKNVTSNIERIENILNGQFVNKSELDKKVFDLTNITNQLEDFSSQLAVISEKILTMKKDLEQLEILKKDKSKLDHRLDLLEQLIKLIGARKFVQFISYKQMLYIAKQATKNLKKMSKDRYAIELSDDSNFVIRDDFLGGVKRKPETLSGGELFTASLSLALALSTQIQLKSKTPIEFFFLDEGFGSLDDELLDTVIETLERLHLENTHVGIISHVKELKERIPAKLIVSNTQYELDGSNVRLELL